ncbi:hypothetical protein [Aneurinibacillus tyrosinisolvens]|uniref:hypothetical protein n=1 Tax=Aneurinibacillus tyrosinisolvens TaxID=1443435 RepID=UPI00063F9ADB|nr:hypothetical protein [Aneurinibacillus tyrosinisolvens]
MENEEKQTEEVIDQKQEEQGKQEEQKQEETQEQGKVEDKKEEEQPPSDEAKGKTFTEEEVNTLVQDGKQELLSEIEQLKAQIKELEQYKPVDKTPDQLQIEKDRAEIFSEKVDLALQKSELSDFKQFISGSTIEEVNASIDAFKKLLNQRDLNNGYQPEGDANAGKKADAYETAKKNGDYKGMFGALLSRK